MNTKIIEGEANKLSYTQKLAHSFKAGWREGNWHITFTAVLFPLAVIVLWLVSLVREKIVSPEIMPGPLVIVIMIPAVLFALFYAGLRQGPNARFGRFSWWLVIVMTYGCLLCKMVHKARSCPAGPCKLQESASVKIAGHGFDMTMQVEGQISEKAPLMGGRRFSQDLRFC
jgi:hypothetical protein